LNVTINNVQGHYTLNELIPKVMKRNHSRRRFISAMAATAAAVGLGGTRCTGSNPGKNVQNGSRETLAETDVLVVGGGPAGIGAAIGAAMQGARTFLIEDCGFFGGVGAWGMGMQLNQMRPKGLPRGKVHELLISKLQALGGQAAVIRLGERLDGSHALLCNVEYLKVAILDALDEVGCKYLVHTRAIDALVEHNRVTGVVVATKHGPMNIRAKAVVDCTGDADVSFFAGAETMTATGELSPSTLLYNTGNISPEDIEKGKEAYLRNEAAARKEFPLIHKGVPGLRKVANSHFFYTNHPGTRDLGEFDASDPFQFSEAECLSRRQVLQSVEALRKYAGEGLKEIELFGAGPRIGVRESRRLLGEYVLTEENAMEGTQFDDAIAWRSGNLDIGHVRLSRMKIHDVPYRALLPVSVDGLLVAGRCISATHVAASAGKSMGNCFATGHAAGIAGALAAGRGKMPREVPVTRIQEALRRDEVDLDFGGQAQDWL
jgi:ribulose 1,5-bisphosphate synthetase/thiazole synthase